MPSKYDRLSGYAQELKKFGKYPLKPSSPWKERKPGQKHPVVTPFIVIPSYQGDLGTNRPLAATLANHSASIEIIDVLSRSAVTSPVIGQSYHLQCRVQNHGAVGCYAGIAEFYVDTQEALDSFAAGTGPKPRPLGYSGVIIPPGGTAIVICQQKWTVTDLNCSILVCIYDPIVDRPQFPYNSIADRHVSRRDIVPDFTGTYVGMEYLIPPAKGEYQLKIVIQQFNNLATVMVYAQQGGHLPLEPQISGSTIVTGSSFVFNCTEQIDGQPFTSNVMTFRLLNPHLLHYTRHKHFLSPSDTRLDQDLVADLRKI